MIAIKRICVLSLFVLTACAPRPQVSEAPISAEDPPAREASNKIKSSTNAEAVTADTTAVAAHAKKAANGKAAVQVDEGIEDKGASLEGNKRQTAASSSASKITSWDVSGALAARSKSKGWSASLNWTQRGASQYQIRLSGPLGSGTVLISRNGGVVTLRDGPKTASSSNAATLLKQQTGVSLPVNNLYYWARGIPAPGSVQSEKRDQAGRLTVLRQAGYTIEFLRYTSASKAVLPSSIRLQGNGVFIKLVINRWRV
jgi:outer membrane lipoprotein LolB